MDVMDCTASHIRNDAEIPELILQTSEYLRHIAAGWQCRYALHQPGVMRREFVSAVVSEKILIASSMPPISASVKSESK